MATIGGETTVDGTSGPAGSQRRHRRAGVETRVDLEIGGIEGFVSGRSEDISVGGMFVRSAARPAEGAPVRFGFRLEPGGPIIRGVGEVAWVRDEDPQRGSAAGIAVAFLDLTEGDRASIAAASRQLAGELPTPPDRESRSTTRPAPVTEAVVVDEAAGPAPPATDEREDTGGEPTGPDALALETAELAAALGSPADEPVPPPREIGDVTLAIEGAEPQAPGAALDGEDGQRLPFPWTLLAGMAAVVVLVVSVGALLLAPGGDGGGDGGPQTTGQIVGGPVAPVPSPKPTRPSVLPPAERLVDLRWSSSLRATRVELDADGRLAADRIVTEALIEPPRFVVRIAALERGDVPELTETAGPDVRRVRVEPSATGGDLVVTLDLATSTVRVSTRLEAGRLTLETR